MPPEWAPQDWIWIGFPHDRKEWGSALGRAREQIAAFAGAVADSGQEVRLLARHHIDLEYAKAMTQGRAGIEVRVFGDIWLRDTGPLVRADGSAYRPRFNGWGEKFLMTGDQTIGAEIAVDAGLPVVSADWVLEGGAIDGDGTGTVLTTEQCLLNPNRNPGMSRDGIETKLASDLGFDRVVWLGDGLINDHTDGHVDNLARFVAPGQVVLPRATGADDPNEDIYADAKKRILDAGLALHEIPSPGLVTRDGEIEPASYVNFAITTRLVVVPTFGSPHDEAGVAAIGELFPDRETVGLPADAVLAGGGGFHCASQQMPSLG